jgi:hypothetical protein
VSIVITPDKRNSRLTRASAGITVIEVIDHITLFIGGERISSTNAIEGVVLFKAGVRSQPVGGVNKERLCSATHNTHSKRAANGGSAILKNTISKSSHYFSLLVKRASLSDQNAVANHAHCECLPRPTRLDGEGG